MAALIALLSELPAGRGQRRAGDVAQRLEVLEGDARAQGAPEVTLAAIKGARLLLELAELPPLPPAKA